MRVAYLVNQYPGLSHSFIRREVQALERRGAEVLRYAIRPLGQGALSEEDRAEAERTVTLVRQGKSALARAFLGGLARSPGGALGALGDAVRLSHRSEAGLLKHLAYWGEAVILSSWLRRDGARHLHAHFGTNAAAVAMLAARLAGLPFSMTVHGPEEFDKPRMIGLPEKVERAAFACAVSSYGVSQLRRLVEPAHWDRIAQVHCGIEPAFHEGAGPGTEGGADFVCVGRLCEQKGQVTLIRAAARLKEAGHAFRLDLVGDGELRGLIEREVAGHGLEDEVRLLGWRSPSEVRASLLSSKCFVLPSYAEGLPVSIMEAFSLGKPVISTMIAGIPELVRDGENGWLVPAADEAALAEAMAAALAATPEERARLGAVGKARTLERHDVDDQAARLLALIEAA
jgi:glycosyltransferase involved in cell wall biosynthesis